MNTVTGVDVDENIHDFNSYAMNLKLQGKYSYSLYKVYLNMQKR